MTSEIILSNHHYNEIITILLNRKLNNGEKKLKNQEKALFKLRSKAPEDFKLKGRCQKYLEEYCKIERSNKDNLKYLFTSAKDDAIKTVEERLVSDFVCGKPLYGI